MRVKRVNYWIKEEGEWRQVERRMTSKEIHKFLKTAEKKGLMIDEFTVFDDQPGADDNDRSGRQ